MRLKFGLLNKIFLCTSTSRIPKRFKFLSLTRLSGLGGVDIDQDIEIGFWCAPYIYSLLLRSHRYGIKTTKANVM